jgi:hypothetical protein
MSRRVAARLAYFEDAPEASERIFAIGCIIAWSAGKMEIPEWSLCGGSKIPVCDLEEEDAYDE